MDAKMNRMIAWGVVLAVATSAMLGALSQRFLPPETTGSAGQVSQTSPPTEAQNAAGQPGQSDFWTTGNKQGVGTAFYDAAMGQSQSNVWFTLANGALSEVYYPDVTTPNLASLEFVYTRGNQTYDEISQMNHSVQLLNANSLLYQQVNTAKDGQMQIAKTTLADPEANAIVMQVNVSSTSPLRNYGLYLYAKPHLQNDGVNNSGQTLVQDGHTYLLATRKGVYEAIELSVPVRAASTGYYGTASDPMTQLTTAHQLTALSRSANLGTIAQAAQIATPHGFFNSTRQLSFEVAIGYGGSQAAAMSVVDKALGRPFATLEQAYVKGWSGYLQQLKPTSLPSALGANAQKQYNIAVMTVKALEDKTHPGAFVASLAIPWGQDTPADLPNVGGYHLVWPRDLYEMASSLYTAGDTASMREAVHFLAGIQQADGSFPQNVWLNGTPYWSGLQMDEVSYPILMAYDLNDLSLYPTLVKRAANYLVQNGPATGEDRWEETGGYSPSTMAAEIAALVCAGTMADQAHDSANARRDFAAADLFRQDVLKYTVTTNGPYGSRYFLRINDTKNPNDGGYMEIANGGGVHQKNQVVDAGFLELVRLGILPANNPIVDQSLNVIDGQIRAQTPIGPMWKRYNFDGYGQKLNGDAYDGSGTGWYWPVFNGERGEFAIAAAAQGVQQNIDHPYTAQDMLAVMQKSANQGDMIPEQIWNGPSIPAAGLTAGGPTDSANPLGWAMAQYVRLAQDIAAGKVLDMPACVAQRYLSH